MTIREYIRITATNKPTEWLAFVAFFIVMVAL